jgi:ubiquinone/menaquinone biosynthesis C-methylase UbiE
MNRFLQEVCRVLTPGGHFLFTDFRRKQEIAPLLKQLNDSGLTLVGEQRITPGVIRALDLDDERRRSLTERLAPRFLHKLAREFAGTRGTTLYKSFESGEREYLSFVLQKSDMKSGAAAGVTQH